MMADGRVREARLGKEILDVLSLLCSVGSWLPLVSCFDVVLIARRCYSEVISGEGRLDGLSALH